MSIIYKSRKIAEAGVKGGGMIKYTAQIVYTAAVKEEAFIEAFRQKAHINEYAAAKKYYDCLQIVSTHFLQNGKIVPFSMLGNFYPRIKSKTVEEEDKVNRSTIVSIDAYFCPNKYFKNQMQKATLIKQKKKGKKIIVEK
ncbi:MAG: hypothetical protein PHC83_05850 [Bacteroidales bacterium]|nr:hypothetical protein [Bacteroidales bacterium]